VSVLGIDTSRTRRPSPFSAFTASAATATSDPVAMTIASGAPDGSMSV